jgi:hypothetical protein
VKEDGRERETTARTGTHEPAKTSRSELCEHARGRCPHRLRNVTRTKRQAKEFAACRRVVGFDQSSERTSRVWFTE